MAKFDRCEICDYNGSTGSHYANAPPGSKGAVRWSGYSDKYLCDECRMSILEEREVDIEEWLLNMDPALADDQAMDTQNTPTDMVIVTVSAEEHTSPHLVEETEE